MFLFIPLFHRQSSADSVTDTSVSGLSRLSLSLTRVAAVLIASQILITPTELIALLCIPGLQDYEALALPCRLPLLSPSCAHRLSVPLLTNRVTVSMTVTQMFGIPHPIHSASLKQRVAKSNLFHV